MQVSRVSSTCADPEHASRNESSAATESRVAGKRRRGKEKKTKRENETEASGTEVRCQGKESEFPFSRRSLEGLAEPEVITIGFLVAEDSFAR